MTYRDKTYCPFWRLCCTGQTCHRRLTKKVRTEAIREYGKPFITFMTLKPECFDCSKLERLYRDGYKNIRKFRINYHLQMKVTCGKTFPGRANYENSNNFRFTFRI